MRRALLIVLLGSVALQAEGPTFTLAIGPLHANDMEADGCYFNIGYGQHATLIAFHPNNMSCERAKELLGKNVRLQVVVEE